VIAGNQDCDAKEVTVPGSVEGFEISGLSVLPHVLIDPQAAGLV
jgi:hypothetical protein